MSSDESAEMEALFLASEKEVFKSELLLRFFFYRIIFFFFFYKCIPDPDLRKYFFFNLTYGVLKLKRMKTGNTFLFHVIVTVLPVFNLICLLIVGQDPELV